MDIGNITGFLPGVGNCRGVHSVHAHISAPARGFGGFNKILDIFKDKKQ